MIEKILLIDPDALFRNLLARRLRDRQFDVAEAETGAQALQLLKERSCDLMITEMKLSGGTTGLQLIKKIKEQHPEMLHMIITAHGSVANAVEAMRAGAADYLTKPIALDAIEAAIKRAELLLPSKQMDKTPSKRKQEFRVIARSPAMLQILTHLDNIAHSHASVCIHGESGTGKEVIASLIHERSPRKGRSFIKVNCAAIPESLIESEFFGHEKGSFTGASARRLGRFELAHGGSLLLDEITEAPLHFQAKLLRAVQEQEFERVGGAHLVKVDVRLISTSNRDIKEAVERKMIREDLYYRLNVIPIYLPPLRERKEEILPLAEYFLERFSAENQRKLKPLNEAAKKRLLGYHWPGNVRELANVVERAVIIDSMPEVPEVPEVE